MTTTTHSPAATALIGIRLLPRHGRAGTPQAAAATSLLDLGEREARRVAESKLVESLVAHAKRSVSELTTQVGGRLDEVAALAVELGLGIAREIVGAAIDKGFVDPTPTVVRCLRDCVHGATPTDLIVRLHPEDLRLVQERLQAEHEVQDEVAAARFVADPSVPRGGVRAETESGRLRYDPRDALERVAAEVRREAAS
jgi:flagellar biosynthesis/type III secretory pathway protein FliH